MEDCRCVAAVRAATAAIDEIRKDPECRLLDTTSWVATFTTAAALVVQHAITTTYPESLQELAAEHVGGILPESIRVAVKAAIEKRRKG